MPDLAVLLAELGAAARSSLWLPVLAWTALALLADAALRLARPSASLGLWVRGALLAVLPALLILPPLLAPWVPSVQPIPPPPASVSDASVSQPPQPIELAAPADAIPASATPDVSSVAQDMASPPASTPDVLIGLATALAVVSALVALGVLAGGLLWLLRYRRALDAAAAPVQADAQALAERFGLRRAVQVASAEPASAPFTLGWRRPVVAVPPGLTGERLELALAHEIAHVRHAHFGWHLAEHVLRALFVWHPLVHVLGRGLALDRERQADAAVLRLWPDRAERYGRLLLSFASNPSPGLALGASSSPLLHRLTAMTRLRPDRRHLARFLGLTVLIVPLVAAAAVLPDRQLEASPTQPIASDPAPTADASAPADTLAQYIASQRGRYGDRGNRVEIVLKPGVPRRIALAIADHVSDGDISGELVVTYDGGEITRSSLRKGAIPPPPPPPAAPEPPPAAPAPPPVPVATDTLEQYLHQRQVWDNNGDVRLELMLKPGTPRRIAEAVADYYADGGRRGELVVRADGIQIRRATLREDAVPPPPPPPPAPEAAPAPPPPPAAPSAPAPPIPPVASTAVEINYGTMRGMSRDRLAAYLERLEGELVETERRIDDIRRAAAPTPELKAEYMRLDIRKSAIEQRLRAGLAIQESRRLDALVDG